jgi:SNF family Na+-dependent transporter
MKFTLIGGVVLFIAAVVVALAQLWLTAWTPEVFIKVEITIGAMFAVLVAIWFTKKEYKDYKRQESNTALDK